MTAPARTNTDLELDVLLLRKETIADGVVRLTLGRPGGAPLPEWQPGAHVDLMLGPGLERQYSLCGDPADRSVFQVAVLREPGSRGGSRFVHDELTDGAGLRVRGPRNHFALVGAPRYLFIAGGIGITPIVPMIAEADARGADWRLVYGGRTRASMAFRDELSARFADRVSLRPQDETGLLDLDGLLSAEAGDTAVYCCGPEPLLLAVEARRPGVHVERFTPKEVTGVDVTFEVELAQSGLTLTVPPGKSILEVVEDAGIPALSSCQEGTCGTCETPVLDGAVDHRDSILTDEEQAENDTMMICVSRARGAKLVLDL
jgi:ferredoxin-NADP reductase